MREHYTPMAKRHNFSPDFKARGALAAIRGDGMIAELAARYQAPPNVIGKLKRTALEGMKTKFSRGWKLTPGASPQFSIFSVPSVRLPIVSQAMRDLVRL